jgi:hypothetical protein
MINWSPCSRIFQLHGDVTITGEGLQNLGLCSALMAVTWVVLNFGKSQHNPGDISIYVQNAWEGRKTVNNQSINLRFCIDNHSTRQWTMNIGLHDWLIVYGFTSRSRIFHLYGDITIAGEGLQNLGLWSALRAFEKGGILIVPHLLWHRTSVLPVSS